MSFFKTAKAEVLAYNSSDKSSFTRTASTKKIASHYDTTPLTSSDIAEKLAAVAGKYVISSNPEDYVYVAVRALTADAPNENFDAFSEKELLSINADLGCRTYQTFNLKPHHVNHRSEDPTQARGVILDTHYNKKNAEHFPELLMAVDKTKDKRLAEGIASGELNSFSMGCTAEKTICSVCNKEAYSPGEFCNHIKFDKGREIEGKVAFEWCEGVVFEEESSVDDPADKSALTQEVILASKQDNNDAKDVKADLELESSMLAVNKNLNDLKNDVKALTEHVTSDKEEDVVEASNEDETNNDNSNITQSTEIVAEDVEKESTPNERGGLPAETPAEEEEEVIEEYRDTLDEEENDDMTDQEYGIQTANKADKKQPAKKAKHGKESLDSSAKSFWSDYFKDYGDALTKSVKRKKISNKDNPYAGALSKKSDAGQMFTKMDKGTGNPPKEFTLKNGNPPKEFRFAKVHNDVDVYPVTSKHWLVAKQDKPIFLLTNTAENAQKFASDKKAEANFARTLITNILSEGLVRTMKSHDTKAIKALYAPTFGTSIVDNPQDDLKDGYTKPTGGIEQGGIEDLDGVDKSKVKEKATSDDGVIDLKASFSLSKQADTAKLMELIDEEERKGTPAEDIVRMMTDYIEAGEVAAVQAAIDTIVDENVVNILKDATEETTSTQLLEALNDYSKEASKKANVVEDAVSDMAETKSEATKDVVADNDNDLKGVTPKVQKDNVYNKGTDDLKDNRDGIVNIKANNKRTPVMTVENLQKLRANITAEVEKEATEKIRAGLEKDFADFKQAFRSRFVRSLRLAAARSDLNLVDNELKIAFADTLLSPIGDYPGMDVELATHLIEGAFQHCGTRYVDSLFKEAEKFLKMSDESFLQIEDDTNTLQVVIPVGDIESDGTVDLADEEYDEEFIEVDMEGYDEDLDLIEQASKSNPVIASKTSEDKSKWNALRGAFKNKLA